MIGLPTAMQRCSTALAALQVIFFPLKLCFLCLLPFFDVPFVSMSPSFQCLALSLPIFSICAPLVPPMYYFFHFLCLFANCQSLSCPLLGSDSLTVSGATQHCLSCPCILPVYFLCLVCTHVLLIYCLRLTRAMLVPHLSTAGAPLVYS